MPKIKEKNSQDKLICNPTLEFCFSPRKGKKNYWGPAGFKMGGIIILKFKSPPFFFLNTFFKWNMPPKPFFAF